MALRLATGADLEERIAAFAREVIRPRAPAMARGEGDGGREVVTLAGQRGLAGLLVPARDGGPGGTHDGFVRLIEAVARECASSVRSS